MKAVDGGWWSSTEDLDRFYDAVDRFLDVCTPDTDMHLVAGLATQHADFPRRAAP